MMYSHSAVRDLVARVVVISELLLHTSRLQSIAISVSLSVFPSVRWRISKNHTFKLHEIFCACYLGPWLGPPLTTAQYVVYFRFSG